MKISCENNLWYPRCKKRGKPCVIALRRKFKHQCFSLINTSALICHTVKHGIFTAVKYCRFSISNFLQEETFAHFWHTVSLVEGNKFVGCWIRSFFGKLRNLWKFLPRENSMFYSRCNADNIHDKRCHNSSVHDLQSHTYVHLIPLDLLIKQWNRS